MKQTKLSRLVCLVLVVLLAAAALTLTACTAKTNETPADTQTAAQQTAADTQSAETETAGSTDYTDIGEGEKLFYFEVTGESGETTSYAVHTDAETVGEALVALDLISGTDSEYGLMVDTVLGEKQDYNEDGMYWAFYENDEYAMSGVDTTQITDGATYAFIATPA